MNGRKTYFNPSMRFRNESSKSALIDVVKDINIINKNFKNFILWILD